MSKTKKVVFIIIASFSGVVLTAYLALGFWLAKPGINGFAVTNGMIRIALTGEDYVSVGKDKYLWKDGCLHEIYGKYETVGYRDMVPTGGIEEQYESVIFKVYIVSIDGTPHKGVSVNVASTLFSSKLHSLSFMPYNDYYTPAE